MTARNTTKQSKSNSGALPGTLAEELKRATDRRKSRYWTYDVVAKKEVGLSTDDLGQKWGHDSDPDTPRQTHSGCTQREPVDNPGALHRRIAELHHHFTRNVEEFVEPADPVIPGEYPTNSPWREQVITSPDASRLTTPPPDDSVRAVDFSEEKSHLSGELVDHEWSLSGELAPNNSCLSGKLAPGDSSGKLVSGELSNHLSGELMDDLSDDTQTQSQLGNVLEGASLILHPSLQLEYFPIEPPRLPEIETSDEEDLVDESLNKLRDLSDNDECERINTMAVIVELRDERPSTTPKDKKAVGASDPLAKTKSADHLETGPRYAELKPTLFHQGPKHFRHEDSEKPDGGWFRATPTKKKRSEFASMPPPRREMPPPDRFRPYRSHDDYYRRDRYHVDSYRPPTPPILDRPSEVMIGNRTFDALFERQQRNMEWQQEMILRLYSDSARNPSIRQPSSMGPTHGGARFSMRTERNKGPCGRRRTGPVAKAIRGSQKPPSGTQPTEAQKPPASGTQDSAQVTASSGMTLRDRISPKDPVGAPRSSKRNQNRNDKKKPVADNMDTELDCYKDETTRLREKYLAENLLPPSHMDVDEPLAPGWDDTRDVDDGMEAAKP